MSDTDSFIEEVTEEVRRDRLFGYFRRYGWIALAVVVLIVGGASYNEYTKAQQRADAQARGDAILAALELDDETARLDALRAIPDQGDGAPVIAMLAAAEAVISDDPDGAAALLADIAGNAELPSIYRDMAIFKRALALAGTMAPEERIALLEPLTVAGGPFRVLAEEQIALAEIEQGLTAQAIERLRAILDDSETSTGLRQRATQLIVALGGELEQA